MDEISQISICLVEEAGKINEISLFEPLKKSAQFDEAAPPLAQRKWSYTHNLPFAKRIFTKVQSFLFKHAPTLIPPERVTKQAKLQTVLAILLAQEPLRDFFLNNPERKRSFFASIDKLTQELGIPALETKEGESPLEISRNLTMLPQKNTSLVEDLVELNLQMAALPLHERSELLQKILNSSLRTPITSLLEITKGSSTSSLSLKTSYAKYQIQAPVEEGEISYSYEKDRSTCSIRTMNQPLGTINQRISADSETGEILGSYSGELSHPENVLEQILLILEAEGKSVSLHEKKPNEQKVESRTILFTSLYSWLEMGKILEQNNAIQQLNKKVLEIGDRWIELTLLHINIPFNACNKYPAPAEMQAKIYDITEEVLIPLTWECWKRLGLADKTLEALAGRLETLHEISSLSFLEKEKHRIEEIDLFKEHKKNLLTQLEAHPLSPLTTPLKTLLTRKLPNGHKLKGIDFLLYLNFLAKNLGISHNKNCQNATDRTAGANAADKGQYAYQKLTEKPFLPGITTEEEENLFSVLYSMYLVWEEPELNTGLSTGFIGEKFYHNFFQKNPETTRYLIRWLRHHPETYLALSNLRP
ncbi:MAG: hypothetical protein K940chlam9_00319 [Chlamydiae bacterium]|nr:hypothetical protein [Chlamydiota bacterium]